MKNITFHINNEAYIIDIGDDPHNILRDTLQKFLSTDANLSTKDLLFAYLQQSQALVALEQEIQQELNKLPSLEQFTS